MLWKIVRAASLSFVVLMVLGVIASTGLPDRTGANFDSACYWTDAMFVFVRCGGNVWLGWLREPIYNLYFTILYPLAGLHHLRGGNSAGWFYLIAGLAAWAAVIVTGLTLWRAAVRTFTLRARSPR